MKCPYSIVLLCTFLLSSCQPKRYPASDDFWTISPTREIEQVHPSSVAEEVTKLTKAKIVLVDYDLVRKDFPELTALSNDQIDRWLLDQVAYISMPQSLHHQSTGPVNTAIEASTIRRAAYRPPRYGRALIYEAKDPVSDQVMGILDVKGAGSLSPGQVDHGNGVATLGESIREFLYENLMRRVLKDANQEYKTVGSYAVIDAGFDVIHADGSTSPAGLYVRQAHTRAYVGSEWLPDNRRMSLQRILHAYAIDPNTNIQGTVDHKGIYDFGHYVVKDNLSNINPAKSVPFSMWGYDKNIIQNNRSDRWFYSKHDYPWQWSHELADGWRKGSANRDDVWRHFVNMLAPVEQKLNTGIGGQGTCRQLLEQIIH